MFLLNEILYLFMLCSLLFIVLTLLYTDIKRLKKENEFLSRLEALREKVGMPQADLISQESAARFASDWITAWNNHDLEQIMLYYTDYICFTSPLVASDFNEPSGTIIGKDALRAYFQKRMIMFPDLHFELVEVFAGVNQIAIFYKELNGGLVSETMIFNSYGLITKAAVCYSNLPEQKQFASL